MFSLHRVFRHFIRPHSDRQSSIDFPHEHKATTPSCLWKAMILQDVMWAVNLIYWNWILECTLHKFSQLLNGKIYKYILLLGWPINTRHLHLIVSERKSLIFQGWANSLLLSVKSHNLSFCVCVTDKTSIYYTINIQRITQPGAVFNSQSPPKQQYTRQWRIQQFSHFYIPSIWCQMDKYISFREGLINHMLIFSLYRQKRKKEYDFKKQPTEIIICHP